MLSRAWKPEDGASYSSVELGMAPDFQRADPPLWGIVEAKGLTRTTTIDLLRIVGAPSWDDRFDWLNSGDKAKPWPVALGGGDGGPTALAGVHAVDCKDPQIKRLEVAGVPGAAVCYQGTKLGIDSAWLYRVGCRSMATTTRAVALAFVESPPRAATGGVVPGARLASGI